MTALNWSKASARERMRSHGAESARGGGSPPQGAPVSVPKITRTKPIARRPVLAEPLIIAEWWKNRRKEVIKVRLSTYEGHNLVDVRTWFGEEGRLKPGKGFCASVKHLPRLAAEITKALAKARQLGLIEDEGTGHA
jgi:transcriptional coactivator p15 (PC4)